MSILHRKPAQETTSLIADIEAHLQQQATRYFDDLEGTGVQAVLKRAHTRKFTWLGEFVLRAAGRHRNVVVKIPFETPVLRFTRQPESPSRNSTEAFEEFSALAMIHAHFSELGDARFGAVRTMDLVKEHSALVMEHVECPTLQTLITRQKQYSLSARPADLGAALTNTGAWLRHFHRLPKFQEETFALTSAGALLRSIQASLEALCAQGHGILAARLRELTERVIGERLPPDLPLALGHGDFGPHNVFVGPDGRVSAFDTLGNARVPPYKDLAYFLVLMKMATIYEPWQGRLFAADLIRRCEAGLLQGYCDGAAVPWVEIRLFELETVLAKWVTNLASCSRATGAIKVAKRLRFLLRDRSYRRYVLAIERQLVDAVAATPFPLPAVRRISDGASGGAELKHPAVARSGRLHVTVMRASELTTTELDAWDSFRARNPDLDSPFFSPGFVQVMSQVRDGVEVGVIRSGDEIVGFFPYERDAKNRGWPVGRRLSDFHAVIQPRGSLPDSELLIRQCGLRGWRYNHLLASQTSFLPSTWSVSGSPYIDLSGGFKAYEAGRRRDGSEFIPVTRRKQRKADREAGKVRFEWNSTDRDVLERLCRWKSAQRKRTHTRDPLSSPWAVRLFEELLAVDSPDFAGVMSVLWFGDTIAAVHLGMRSRTAFHIWFPTYNQDVARYSPGAILMLRMLEECAHRGLSRIDLGKGMERYKSRLMTGSRLLLYGAVRGQDESRALYAARRLARQTQEIPWVSDSVRSAKRLIRGSRHTLDEFNARHDASSDNGTH